MALILLCEEDIDPTGSDVRCVRNDRICDIILQLYLSAQRQIALFDMPNSNRFDILSISIFSEISLSILIFSKISYLLDIDIFRMALSISISISIFSKFADISTIDINIRYFIHKSGQKTPK